MPWPVLWPHNFDLKHQFRLSSAILLGGKRSGFTMNCRSPHDLLSARVKNTQHITGSIHFHSAGLSNLAPTTSLGTLSQGLITLIKHCEKLVTPTCENLCGSALQTKNKEPFFCKMSNRYGIFGKTKWLIYWKLKLWIPTHYLAGNSHQWAALRKGNQGFFQHLWIQTYLTLFSPHNI